jgi:glycosyltransferase involved in cell wall biosynthesis
MPSALAELSIILPARNEAASLLILLPDLRARFPQAEIIVVDDGSSDETPEVCAAHGVRRLAHPYSLGNGAAIKAGARAAQGAILCFMDADSQHNPAEIAQLLAKFDEGYDMVVGARATAGHASPGRRYANAFYNWFASWMTHCEVKDLTSGFRVARASVFREFLSLLPNGFSYPTTCTMAFFRAGYKVAYVPINARTRIGQSHINPLRDGLRFLLIIFKIGTLFSPLKIFLPLSLAFFVSGLGYYGYTFAMEHRFTNMSALLFSNSILIFLIGLVSEQITMLMYRDR